MKVLFSPTIMELEKSIPDLRKAYPDFEFVYSPTREAVADLITDADIYVGWLNRAIFQAAQNLKWIQSPSSGVNYYLDIPELVESDVLLTSASSTHAACLAESTFGMILAFTRGIRTSIFRQQQHEWAGRELRPVLKELTGSTLGIIGFGSFGRALAKRADAFDMRVIAVDAFPHNKPEHVDDLWPVDRLDDLLRQSDYVVVAVPITPETENLIDAEKMALMKPDAMLVGMSRGGIIEQDALARALREKKLAAAALDVCQPEPLPADSELWDLDNLLITAHIAGGTQHERKYVIDIFRENLERFQQGNFPLRNQVNKQHGW